MVSRRALLALAFAAPLLTPTAGAPAAAPPPDPDGVQEESQAVYMVYYWRARPGHEAEYAAYIRDVAEKIDEEARKAGVFEWVHTYTPAIRTGAPAADWTHMRVFRLSSWAALDGFSAGLDAAGRRIYPDPGEQPSSAELRDLVRQEIWRDFR